MLLTRKFEPLHSGVQKLLPTDKYIETTSHDNTKLSTLVGEWKHSHNFHLEGLSNYLYYILVPLNLHSFETGYECPKSAIFGVRREGTNFVAKIVQ